MRMRDAYRHRLDSGAARPDAAQAAVAEKLAILGDELVSLARPPAGGWLARLLGRPVAAAPTEA